MSKFKEKYDKVMEDISSKSQPAEAEPKVEEPKVEEPKVEPAEEPKPE